MTVDTLRVFDPITDDGDHSLKSKRQDLLQFIGKSMTTKQVLEWIEDEQKEDKKGEEGSDDDIKKFFPVKTI